eukprot:2709421-Prorocentrum_lima.AAC.1
MTSSLVGSEMCIRDSLCCLRPLPFLFWGDVLSIRVGALRWVHHLSPSEAVSYTHLTLPTICSV